MQAIYHPRDIDLVFHDILVCLRRPGVLANPRDVLLRLVCVNYEKAASVSVELGFSALSFTIYIYRHMIKYRYVPFDWGRKTRYGSSSN